jgi:hypothetical protein
MADALSLPPHTRRKSAEAAFFLAHMVAETQKPEPHHDPEAFGYYFSAFLSAARSVTFVLQAEDKDRYERVFQPWLDSLPREEQVLFRSMNDFRRAELHLTGVEVKATTALIPLKEVRPGKFEPVTVDWHWFEELLRQPEGWGMVVLAPQFEVGGQPAEVIATCQRYMALVSDLLQRWT